MAEDCRSRWSTRSLFHTAGTGTPLQYSTKAHTCQSGEPQLVDAVLVESRSAACVLDPSCLGGPAVPESSKAADESLVADPGRKWVSSNPKAVWPSAHWSITYTSK